MKTVCTVFALALLTLTGCGKHEDYPSESRDAEPKPLCHGRYCPNRDAVLQSPSAVLTPEHK